MIYRSSPAMAGGMAAAWTGVGFSKDNSARALSRRACRDSSVNTGFPYGNGWDLRIMSLVYHRLEKPRWCLPVPGAGTGRQANVGLLLGYGNEAVRIEAGQRILLHLHLLHYRAQFRIDTVGGVQYLRILR